MTDMGQSRLDDPTTVIVTDGTPEAEAVVMRARIEAAQIKCHCGAPTYVEDGVRLCHTTRMPVR
jgi:hypothetical protein